MPSAAAGYGRLIMSWTYPLRQKIDLITQHYVYKNDEDEEGKPYTTVWARNRKSDLAVLDVMPENGIAPTSALIKLVPNSEYRFHAQQRGTFDEVLSGGQVTKSLHETNLQLRFYDQHGLVTTQLASQRLQSKENEDETFHVWQDAFVLRVEENEVLSLDGNEFMVADNEIAMGDNGGFAKKTAGAVIDQMQSHVEVFGVDFISSNRPYFYSRVDFDQTIYKIYSFEARCARLYPKTPGAYKPLEYA